MTTTGAAPAGSARHRLADRIRALPPWVELPFLAVLAVAIALVVKALVAQAFYIPSASMEPQLEVGDRVVVSKLSYRLHDPRRGDVVVFGSPFAGEPPRAPLPVALARDLLEGIGVVQPRDDDFIKRVVALPGETVEGRDGRVWIDGRPLVEPYLSAGTTTSEFAPVAVPADHVFVLGDNRANSTDSRRFGPVPVDGLVGRAVLRVWPVTRTAFL